MRVLTLQLRGDSAESLEKSEKRIYKWVIFLTMCFWLGVIIAIVLTTLCMKRGMGDKCADGQVDHQDTQYLNGGWFSLLFFLMVFTAVPLCKVLKELSEANRTLATNVKWLTTIFFIFTVGFLSRAIYDFVTTIDGNFITIYLGLALPLLWDFLPVFLMALFHLKEVLAERREAKKAMELGDTVSDKSSIVLGFKERPVSGAHERNSVLTSLGHTTETMSKPSDKPLTVQSFSFREEQ